MQITKTAVIKGLVKLYFAGAVAGSFTHLMHASEKLGGHGWEAVAAPAMIDGMFLIAMILRSDEFATRTQKIGFRLMLVMGAISLAGNIYAGSNAFGYLFGTMLPAFLLLGEWLADRQQIVSAQAEAEATAKAAAELATMQAAQDAADKKAASIAKGKATRAANKAKAASKQGRGGLKLAPAI